jgi:hypothetical protein
VAKTCRVDPRFHRYLIALRILRELADYGSHAPIERETVSEAIRRAAEFLALA